MNTGERASIRWRSDTQHNLLVSPAVTAELVISAGLELSKRGRVGYLQAWERDTGRLRWSYSGKTNMGLPGGILGTPATRDNLICFASGRGELWCLELRSGLTQWEAQAGGPVVTATAIADDQLFFTSEDGSLSALELATGRLRWTFQTADAIRAAPALEDGHVIVGSWDGSLYAVTVAGELLWQADLSPARPTAVAISDGRVVFFDTATGEIRAVAVRQDAGAWRIEEEWRLPTGHRTGVQPVLARGAVCWTSREDDRVTCVEVASGKELWTASTGSSPLTPIVGEDRLLVVGRDGRISALDLQTGGEQWRVETGIQFTAEPAMHEGVLYAGAGDRALYALALTQ